MNPITAFLFCRVKRWQFWLLGLPGVWLFTMLGLFGFAILGASDDSLTPLLYVVYLPSMIWLLAARCRDCGKGTGWVVAALVIPFIWIIIGCSPTAKTIDEQVTEDLKEVFA